jgi:hypothetical protein
MELHAVGYNTDAVRICFGTDSSCVHNLALHLDTTATTLGEENETDGSGRAPHNLKTKVAHHRRAVADVRNMACPAATRRCAMGTSSEALRDADKGS